MRNLLCLMFVLAFTTLCFAGELKGKYVKVLLTNGRTLSGKVSSQTKKEIKIQAYGGGITFQNDDIKEISELDENGVELVKARDLKPLQEAKQAEVKKETKDVENKTAANSTSNKESSSKNGLIDGALLYSNGNVAAATTEIQHNKSYQGMPPGATMTTVIETTNLTRSY